MNEFFAFAIGVAITLVGADQYYSGKIHHLREEWWKDRERLRLRWIEEREK